MSHLQSSLSHICLLLCIYSINNPFWRHISTYMLFQFGKKKDHKKYPLYVIISQHRKEGGRIPVSWRSRSIHRNSPGRRRCRWGFCSWGCRSTPGSTASSTWSSTRWGTRTRHPQSWTCRGCSSARPCTRRSIWAGTASCWCSRRWWSWRDDPLGRCSGISFPAGVLIKRRVKVLEACWHDRVWLTDYILPSTGPGYIILAVKCSEIRPEFTNIVFSGIRCWEDRAPSFPCYFPLMQKWLFTHKLCKSGSKSRKNCDTTARLSPAAGDLTATLMCLVMSTSQGLRLQRRDSLTISHRSLALETLRDRPRPQVFEQGLHEVVWVMQFLCQLRVSAGAAANTHGERRCVTPEPRYTLHV